MTSSPIPTTRTSLLRSAPPRPPPLRPPPPLMTRSQKDEDNLSRRSQLLEESISVEAPASPTAPPPTRGVEAEVQTTSVSATTPASCVVTLLTPMSPNKANLEGQWKKKKGPAPARPTPPKRQVKKLPRKAVNMELLDIEVKQLELERQGVDLEKTIREVCEKSDKEREEAAIGNKMGEEETMRGREEKVTWDGHSSTAEHAARAARVNISLNDQIEQIHRNKGLIPDSAKESIGPQSSVQVHAMPPQQMAPPPPVTVVSMQPPQPVPVPQPQHVAVMQMRPPPQMVVPAQQMFMAPAPPHIPSFGMHHMQQHAAPAPPMHQMEMDEPPNKKTKRRGQFDARSGLLGQEHLTRHLPRDYARHARQARVEVARPDHCGHPAPLRPHFGPEG